MPDYPDDILADPLSYEDLSRWEAINQLMGMVEKLRARNAALIEHIATSALRHGSDGAAVIVTIGGDAKGTSILAWRDHSGAVRSVAL